MIDFIFVLVFNRCVWKAKCLETLLWMACREEKELLVTLFPGPWPSSTKIRTSRCCVVQG